MRRTKLTIATAALAVLAALGVTAGPGADAAPPNCTPDLATGAANTALGGPPPVGTPYTCANPVHPGARISVNHYQIAGRRNPCTANFLFRGSDGRNYLGTAGHCTLTASNVAGDVGEVQYPTGQGPAVRNSRNEHIGRIAYAVQQGPKDFALIRLDPGITFDEDMPHWGPVTGTNTSDSFTPTELRWVGHGDGIGSVLYARSGMSLYTTNPNTIDGAGVVAPGDSGGPVVDAQGRAVGVNVAIGVGPLPQIVSRLPVQLARASAVTGITFTLRT